MTRAEFAEKVRSIRGREKLSQSEAAEAWGVSLRTLQEWEIERSMPPEFFAKCVLFYLRWRNKVPGK